MEPIYKYESAAIALTQLKDLGYIEDFNLKQAYIQKHLDEIQIAYVYRYEGNEDPGDESIVYGLELKKQKGVFISGYSAEFSDELSLLLWKKASHKL